MMKEDYLWDKTGEDADIEKLENALAVFRYKETAPPELPAKVLPFRKEESRAPQRRIFSFAVAAAACLLFGIIALGVWIQVLKNNAEIPADLAEKSKTEIVLPTPEPPIVDGNIVPPVDNFENAKRFPARKFVANRKNAAVKISLNIAKARNVKAAKPGEKLTKEEQYAYDQLMLALSITSSKFKLVKDKVEGTEEKNTVVKGGQ
jgi:hypothetical protein